MWHIKGSLNSITANISCTSKEIVAIFLRLLLLLIEITLRAVNRPPDLHLITITFGIQPVSATGLAGVKFGR